MRSKMSDPGCTLYRHFNTAAGTTAVEFDADALVAEVMRDAAWREKFAADFDDAFGPAEK